VLKFVRKENKERKEKKIQEVAFECLTEEGAD
jgi:hypothetical protein